MQRVERGNGLGGWKATEGMGDVREGSWVLHKRLTVASGRSHENRDGIAADIAAAYVHMQVLSSQQLPACHGVGAA